ncbi:glutathione synthetase-like [Atheta coriaria]|uniref:glutathione synthetase-like n=1 Tax=Dalotia coriaria TaxID=877792 RepID=UPI0031F401CA
MSNEMPTAIPLPLSDEVLRELIPKAKDWALMHGAAMRSKTSFSADSLNFAPFVLTPSAVPRKEFQRAVDLQCVINKLVHAVAHNREFLVDCLKETIKVDEFTKNLFNIYNIVTEEGITQRTSLAILRSDYMSHSLDNNRLKQVEVNTIACSFAGISSLLLQLNSFILAELHQADKLANMPENHALEGICSGMLTAHRHYGVPNAVILFLVEDTTYNICDQRFHEFEIARLNPRVRVKRRTLTDIAVDGRLGDKRIYFSDDFEVAVVYFRSGYEPDHYVTQGEWDARLMIERSLAIKCPSIQYHLAGTKKVQQELASPGCLERFLDDPNEVEAVRSIFTGLYSLDMDDEGNKNVRMALDHPERYVLKPQREGGGNNIYGHEIHTALSRMRGTERTGWILMQRIEPPIARSYIIRPGGPDVPEMVDMVSELGIFGVIIGDETNILENEQVGHMLRTKVATANEAGVAAGSGALDSPFLID